MTSPRRPRRSCTIKSPSKTNKDQENDNDSNNKDIQQQQQEEEEDENPQEISIYTGRRRRSRKKPDAYTPTTNISITSNSSSSTTTKAQAKALKEKAQLRKIQEEKRWLGIVLEMAKYEIEVDPYRGIFASRDDDDDDDDDDDYGDDNDEEERKNPWIGCSQVLQQFHPTTTAATTTRPTTTTLLTTFNHDEKEEKENNSSSSPKIAKRCLCCPSLSTWYNQQSKTMPSSSSSSSSLQQQKKKKGKEEVTTTTTTTTTTSTASIDLQQEQHENTSVVADDDDDTLDKKESKGVHDNDDDSKENNNKPSPPLVFARRAMDNTNFASSSCPCDYNPYCLASLGGAMDDHLHRLIELEERVDQNIHDKCVGDENKDNRSDVNIQEKENKDNDNSKKETLSLDDDAAGANVIKKDKKEAGLCKEEENEYDSQEHAAAQTDNTTTTTTVTTNTTIMESKGLVKDKSNDDEPCEQSSPAPLSSPKSPSVDGDDNQEDKCDSSAKNATSSISTSPSSSTSSSSISSCKMLSSLVTPYSKPTLDEQEQEQEQQQNGTDSYLNNDVTTPTKSPQKSSFHMDVVTTATKSSKHEKLKNLISITTPKPDSIYEEPLEEIMRSTADMNLPTTAASDNEAVIDLCDSDGSDQNKGSLVAGGNSKINDGEDEDIQSRKFTFVNRDSIHRHLKAFVVVPSSSSSSSSSDGSSNSNKGEEKINVLTIEKCMDMISLWHKSLSFFHPLNNNVGQKKNIMISIPPGMRNLGATCYLNSQFQCLAQNPAFTSGVFAWKEQQQPQCMDSSSSTAQTTNTDSGNNSNSTRMNRVLSTMQTLLARMILGPDNIVCTDEFASSLGLINDEMQDPNEFARLLFDRMHESFQQSSSSASSPSLARQDQEQRRQQQQGKENEGNLSELLPRIFRGVSTYETVCLECQQLSQRSENFMDLTLQIAQEPHEADDTTTAAGYSKRSKTSKKDSVIVVDNANNNNNLVSNKDVNVQHCLNLYLHSEILQGDNQYHCNNCNAKRNARRTVSFGILPPVLNIQLARYVFDRKMLMKKKLTDKVLLPRVLYVPKKEKSHCSNGITTTHHQKRKRQNKNKQKEKQQNAEYILCAVLNHLGSSAYGGHYIAEAMDWSTGTWYEYNDDKVKLLRDGPSCSFMPPSYYAQHPQVQTQQVEKRGGNSSKKTARIRGSSDAYNMFYVEKSYLAKHARGLIQRNNDLSTFPSSSLLLSSSALAEQQAREQHSTVIRRVTQERIDRYQMLTDLKQEKKRTSQRMLRRRAGILRSMFPLPSSSCFVRDGDDMSLQEKEEECKQDDKGTSIAVSTPCRSISPLNNKSNDKIPMVWVHREILQRFVSCADELDDVLLNHQDSVLIKHKHLLCMHGVGLHPRVAREGKLVPWHVYNALVELLLGERRLLKKQQRQQQQRQDSDADGNMVEDGISEINDCVITPESNLYCPECANSYKDQLKQKVNILEQIMSLYEDLPVDSSKNDLDPSSMAIQEKNTEKKDKYVYAISRSFVTSFRKIAEQKIKAASSLLSPQSNNTTSSSISSAGLSPTSSSSQVSGNEGLDSLDLDDFLSLQKTATCRTNAPNSIRRGSSISKMDSNSSADGISDEQQGSNNLDLFLDTQVNQKITCAHGNSNVMNNRRIVRYVPRSVWEKVISLFPSAICQERELQHCDDREGKEDKTSEYDDGYCQLCRLEKDEKAQLTDKLTTWAKQTLSSSHNMNLQHLFNGCGNSSEGGSNEEAAMEMLRSDAGSSSATETQVSKYYLVHEGDVNAWREGLTLAKSLLTRKSGAKISAEETMQLLQNIFLVKREHFNCSTDREEAIDIDASSSSGSQPCMDQKVALPLCWRIQPLVCTKHKKCMSGSMNFIESLQKRFNGTHFNRAMHNKTEEPLELLKEDEYIGFIDSLKSLESIISPSRDQKVRHEETQNGSTLCREMQDMSREHSFAESHPTVTVVFSWSPKDDVGLSKRRNCENTLNTESNTSDKMQLSFDFSLQPTLCEDKSCSVPSTYDMRKARDTADISCEDSSKTSLKRRDGNGTDVDKQNSPAEKQQSRSRAKDQIQNSPTNFIERDSENKWTVRVHEIERQTEIHETVAKIISEHSAKQQPQIIDDFNGQRRSTRKRKTRSAVNPNHTIHKVFMKPNENLANLRLMLYQEYRKSPLYQNLVLIPIPSRCSGVQAEGHSSSKSEGEKRDNNASSSSECYPLTVDLPFGWNNKQMCDILSNCMGFVGNEEDKNNENNMTDSVINVILYYDDSVEGKKKQRLSRDQKEEREQIEDNLVLSLTEISNFGNTPSPSNERRKDLGGNFAFPGSGENSQSQPKDATMQKKGRRRREERGFRGTFLQSMHSMPSSSNDDEIVSVNESPPSTRESRKRELDKLSSSPESAAETGSGKLKRSPITDNGLIAEECSTVTSNKDNFTPSLTTELKELDNQTTAGHNRNIITTEQSFPFSKELQMLSDEEHSNVSVTSESDTSVKKRSTSRTKALDRKKGIKICSKGDGSWQPTSRQDLSAKALLRTKPMYPVKDLQVDTLPLPLRASELDTFDRDLVQVFMHEAKDNYSQQTKDSNDAQPPFMQLVEEHLSPVESNIEAARHLYRNFIDSPDPVDGPRNERRNPPIKLYISRRELDIMLYYCRLKKSHIDCLHLMPYRRENGVRPLFDWIKEMGLHNKKSKYMDNVMKCVGLIVRMEKK